MIIRIKATAKVQTLFQFFILLQKILTIRV